MPFPCVLSHIHVYWEGEKRSGSHLLSSFFYYMFIYKTALQISLMIDDCEFAKFIGLSSKLLHFNTSEASMTPLFKVSHARAQATHSIFQSPQITLDETFSILYTLQFLYSFLFTHTFFLLSSLC